MLALLLGQNLHGVKHMLKGKVTNLGAPTLCAIGLCAMHKESRSKDLQGAALLGNIAKIVVSFCGGQVKQHKMHLSRHVNVAIRHT